MRYSLLLLLLVLAFACTSSHAADEVRGAWVTAWNKGYLTPEETDATIAAAKKARINTLFIQVRKTADAYYKSDIEPRADNIPSKDYDPLAYAIQRAHAEGIKVHAWINVCRVWMGKAMPSDQNHLVLKHPDWLNRDSAGNTKASDGMFIDPGVPEARDYVVSVVKDIATKYDVDGIHLDYIRYPGKDWGYSETSLKRFYENSGRKSKPGAEDSAWCRWRRDQVTELVKMIRAAVKAAKPNAVLSAATITWKDCQYSFSANCPYTLVYQDWRGWLRNGLIDANVPMNYRSEGTQSGSTQYRAWLRGFARWNGGKPTYVGIDIYHNKAKEITTQIQAAQKAKMSGFVLFSLNDLPEREAIVNALAAPVTAAAETGSSEP